MIDVDEKFSLRDAGAHRAESLKAGRVGSNDAVKCQVAFGFLQDAFAIKEGVFLRNRVFVPADDLLSFVTQGQGEAELGAHAIPVRADVSDDAETAAVANTFDDFVDYFRVCLHPATQPDNRTG